jgi:hypothetical protein
VFNKDANTDRTCIANTYAISFSNKMFMESDANADQLPNAHQDPVAR